MNRINCQLDTELDTALLLVNDYFQREFGLDMSLDDQSYLENISLLYTFLSADGHPELPCDSSDGEISFQVFVDLVHPAIRYEINEGTLLAERRYNTLAELIEHELRDLSFENLYGVPEVNNFVQA